MPTPVPTPVPTLVLPTLPIDPAADADPADPTGAHATPDRDAGSHPGRHASRIAGARFDAAAVGRERAPPGRDGYAQPSPTAAIAVVIGAGTGGGDGPAGGRDLAPTILTPQRPDEGPFSFSSFGDVGGGIEWVVPSVLVTVPGFLLIAVGLAQLFGGFLWLPLARRWLRGDGRRTTLTNLSRPR